MKTMILFFLLVVGLALPVSAQEVFVTTQDFSALRAGPGRLFERLTVVPAGTTLPALGRTVNNNWIQVEYEGQRGWIASWLLVWTGDWFNLPVDGVAPLPFARRTLTMATTNRETPYYTIYTHDPSLRVGTLPTDTTLEITGRFGSGDFIWLQFYRDGAYYWAGAWNFNIEGETLILTDAAGVYPYGRVLGRVRAGLLNARASYESIRSIWRAIDAQGSTTCNDIPRRAREIEFLERDLDFAPLLTPAAEAIRTGIVSTNRAIELFEDVCSGQTRVITREIVDEALAAVGEAERAFLIADRLFDPLAERDPLLGGGN